MRSAIKAAAVAVICCAGIAFADPATDQTPPAVTNNGNTVQVADNGQNSDPPSHDGMRDGHRRPGQQDNRDQRDGRDDGHGRGGPMMGMRGRMDGGWMTRMHERGEASPMQPHGLMLGVETAAADPALSSQLNLPDGIGLVVEQVLPRSAAQTAGVEKYDLLEKLDDQIVVNPEQVSVLIKMHKAGDKLTLTVIRHGKPTELTATLGAATPAQRPGRPGRHANAQPSGEPGATPDTSGVPAQPAPAPRMEIPPRADQSSADLPAAEVQPTAALADVLQQFADLFVD